MNTQRLRSLLVTVSALVLLLVVSPLVVYAADFFEVTQQTTCLSKTYHKGDIIPANTFNSLSACKSYIQSFVDFADDNVFVDQKNKDGTKVTPNDATWCGGQAQFPCTTDSANACDTGYVVSEIGSCVARAADDSQYILFRECTERGRSVADCEEIAFGGQEYLESNEASLVQECMDTINNDSNINFDPEYCQAASSEGLFESSDPQNTAFCINEFLNGRNSSCGSLTAQEVNALNFVVLNGRSLNTGEESENYNTNTNNNRAETISTIIDRCERTESVNRTGIDCTDFAYQSVTNNDTVDLRVVSTCLIGSIEECSKSGGSTQYYVSRCESYGYTAADCREIFDGDNPGTTLQDQVFNTSNPQDVLLCLDEYATDVGSLASNLDTNCQSMSSRISVLAGDRAQVAENRPESESVSATVQVSTVTTIPSFATPIEADKAIVYISMGNGQSVGDNVFTIKECASAGSKLGLNDKDCTEYMLSHPNVSSRLSGPQIALCIDQPKLEFCPQAKEAVVAQITLEDKPLIEATSNCSKLGACVDGRTCIFQGTNVMTNVGDKCTTEPQVRTCEADVDAFSTNGKKGAPCCGGGKVECGSGVCNAAPGVQGECTEVVEGSSLVGQSGEASVGITDEARTDCSKANGVVQGTVENGFSLKCDFDGNGSFGYHQGTGYIYGSQAAGSCEVLCSDPTADVEGAAKTKYQARQIAVAQAQVNSSSGLDAVVAAAGQLSETRCETGTFESSFACAAWFEGPCLEQADGCFREAANQDERVKVCGRQYESAYECSRLHKESCLLYPTNGCYAPKTKVYAAQEIYSEQVEAGRAEIAVYQNNLLETFLQSSSNLVGGVGQSFSNIFGPLVGTLQGTNPAPTELPFENVPISGALDGGVGTNTGAPQNNGSIQVETYCQTHGYGSSTHKRDGEWYCKDAQGDEIHVLNQDDYTVICNETYSDSAVARLAGISTDNANNWHCYPAE